MVFCKDLLGKLNIPYKRDLYFKLRWKAKEGKITFSGEENSETIPFEACAKLHFSIFLDWFPRNPTLSYSAIRKAGKLASKAAGKLSTDLKSLPTCLVFTGAVESSILIGIVWVVHTQHCTLSVIQKQTGRKYQPSISTNEKKQISLDGKHIQRSFLLLIWETSRLIHKGFLKKAQDRFSIGFVIIHFIFSESYDALHARITMKIHRDISSLTLNLVHENTGFSPHMKF